ncbi:biotin transporter BioY [Haloglomus halophilum]|uniref:biotin transporter BioY n=1 Tax=Haloglomus halophilum TaxID=2962672 RepID=UPI0020CA259A|nr:biotin transporter BioY [Haloglomus halophilum]
MSAATENVELVGQEIGKNVARAAMLAALTGAFAYVSFPNPVSPIAITLQGLGIFLAGIFLGPVWGGLSIVLYLVAGAAGAPVFQGGAAGIGQFAGSSGGYLFAFPVAAAAIGALVHGFDGLRDPSEVPIWRLAGAMTIGVAIIYVGGIVGLMVVLGLGPVEAFFAGAAAFIPAEALKMAAAVGIVNSEEFSAE